MFPVSTAPPRILLEFAGSLNYSDIGWQLGNEPNSLQHQLNVTLPPRQLGKAALNKSTRDFHHCGRIAAT